jgi:hypothetical protein
LTPQFRAGDQLPPIGVGFYQVWRNNLRLIGREGDLVAFHSLFMLGPPQKLMWYFSQSASLGAISSASCSAGKLLPARSASTMLSGLCAGGFCLLKQGIDPERRTPPPTDKVNGEMI